MKKRLNIGLIGYGFMGRAHSNAFAKAPHFFDLPYEPVLKTVCARNPERAKNFAEKWGYQGIETDWRKVVASPDIDPSQVPEKRCSSPEGSTCAITHT